MLSGFLICFGVTDIGYQSYHSRGTYTTITTGAVLLWVR